MMFSVFTHALAFVAGGSFALAVYACLLVSGDD